MALFTFLINAFGVVTDMGLSEGQLKAFAENGYLHLPGLISENQVNAAIHAINCSIGAGMKRPENGLSDVLSYCDEIRNSPVVMQLLYESKVWGYVESMIGEGNAHVPGDEAQIALRFPTPLTSSTDIYPHIDGMHYPGNGVPEGEIHNFTMLVGVALSDVNGPDSGNFTVWPGTHLLLEEYFRECGPNSLLDGMPTIDYPDPQQLLVKAGDVVIAHYQLAHGVAVNTSPHTRYAIYFRIEHQDLRNWKWEALADIWLGWKSLTA